MTYEYICNNGHKTEKRNCKVDEISIKCPVCSEIADRIISSSPVGFNKANLKIQREFGHKM